MAERVDDDLDIGVGEEAVRPGGGVALECLDGGGSVEADEVADEDAEAAGVLGRPCDIDVLTSGCDKHLLRLDKVVGSELLVASQALKGEVVRCSRRHVSNSEPLEQQGERLDVTRADGSEVSPVKRGDLNDA